MSKLVPFETVVSAFAARPRMLGVLFVAVLALAAWSPSWICPVWAGRATLVIGPDPAMLRESDSDWVDGVYHSFGTKHETIYSHAVAADAARLALGLEEFESPVLTTSAMQREIERLRQESRQELSALPPSEHAAQIRDSLTSAHDGRTQCVDLRALHPDPDVATLWAWSVAEASCRRHRDRLREVYERTATRIEFELRGGTARPDLVALRRARSRLLTEAVCGEGPVQISHVSAAAPFWGEIPERYRVLIALAVASGVTLVVAVVLAVFTRPARRTPRAIPVELGIAP